MAFRVGQKVVCVDASACPVWGILTLKEGRIYTVDEVGFNEVYNMPVLLLAEDLSPHPDNYYQARRFRPVVERKTDISIFTAMLKPNRVNA